MHHRVWGWYKVYCYLNAFLNLGMAAALLALRMHLGDFVTEPDPELREALLFAYGLGAFLFAGMGLVFGILNFLLVSRPRTQAWYTAHLINIVLGLGTGCLSVPLVFLLLAWVKPAFKEWFLNPEPTTGG